MKKNLKENELKILIEKSIKKIIKEVYSTNRMDNHMVTIFDDEKLHYLEKLVNIFTHNRIKIKEDDNGNVTNVEWSDFIHGIITLYEMSKEKIEFDNLNIKQVYQKYVNNGRENDFWSNSDYHNYEYIDNYIGKYASTEMWDKYMPTPEKVKQMSDYFVKWLGNEIENEIRVFEQNKWSEYNYINNTLSKNL